MPHEDDDAGEAKRGHEVRDVVIPPGRDSSEGLQPGEKAFNFPAAAVTTQRPPILALEAVGPIGKLDDM